MRRDVALPDVSPPAEGRRPNWSRRRRRFLTVAIGLLLFLLLRSWYVWYWSDECPVVVEVPSERLLLQVCAVRVSWLLEGFHVYADLYRLPSGFSLGGPLLIRRDWIDSVDIPFDVAERYREVQWDPEQRAFADGGRLLMRLPDTRA